MMDNFANITKTFKSTLETVSLSPTSAVVVKFQRAVKIVAFDLEPYIDEEHGFVDPDFLHTVSSIRDTEHTVESEYEWTPAELMLQHTNYSNFIVSIESNMFSKKAIAYALTLINWFANHIFCQIFLRELSSLRLYTFDVMIDGVFVTYPIDSYIPINHHTKSEVFTKNYKGSIFPCLYEKLLAKIYGDYYSITSEFIDIVELQTFFCREQISISQGINNADLREVILKKINEKSIVTFRTRNSIRLQSFGLQSNHVYVISKLIDKGGEWIVQFLELEGESWIGKRSKLRSHWRLQQKTFLQSNNIVIDSPEVKENYMTLSDMRGLGRELVILNNTTQFHKNYHICGDNTQGLSMYRFELDQRNKIMLRVNYKRRKCYNTIFLIQVKKRSSGEMAYHLIQSFFKEDKDSNYLEAVLDSGSFVVVVYNSHPQEHNLSYNLTIYGSNSFIDVASHIIQTHILHILENTFKEYFSQLQIKEQIVFKQLYSTTGMAFIYIKPFKGTIQIKLNQRLFRQSKILPLNRSDHCEQIIKQEIHKDHCEIMMFRCLWSKKQNIVFQYDSAAEIEKIAFPPLGSVKLTQKIAK